MGFSFIFVSLSELGWTPFVGSSTLVSDLTLFMVSMSEYRGRIVALSSSLDI